MASSSRKSSLPSLIIFNVSLKRLQNTPSPTQGEQCIRYLKKEQIRISNEKGVYFCVIHMSFTFFLQISLLFMLTWHFFKNYFMDLVWYHWFFFFKESRYNHLNTDYLLLTFIKIQVFYQKFLYLLGKWGSN